MNWQIFSRIPQLIALIAASVLLAGCAATIPSTPTASHSTVPMVVDSRIDDFLTTMVAQEHFSGAAMVVRNGEIVHAKAYGSAASGRPNNIETAFHVASVTKQFTAAAILQLVESETLNLAESINHYLPERYRAPIWSEVTVHHLLSHSSGITDYEVTRDYYDVVDGFCLGDTVDGMILEAMSKDLEFVPGTQHRYSNIGFTLLGEIIEETTGTPFDRYLHENILVPMGMLSSRIHVEGHVPEKNEAAGHRWDEMSGVHVKDDVVSLPVTAPDGGLVTTLGDFLLWARIYSGHDQSILSQESIEKMTTPQIETGASGSIDAYGYGLGVGQRLIGHSGYIVGFRSTFVYVPENDSLVVVFTNNTTNNPGRISGGLLTRLFSSET